MIKLRRTAGGWTLRGSLEGDWWVVKDFDGSEEELRGGVGVGASSEFMEEARGVIVALSSSGGGVLVGGVGGVALGSGAVVATLSGVVEDVRRLGFRADVDRREVAVLGEGLASTRADVRGLSAVVEGLADRLGEVERVVGLAGKRVSALEKRALFGFGFSGGGVVDGQPSLLSGELSPSGGALVPGSVVSELRKEEAR